MPCVASMGLGMSSEFDRQDEISDMELEAYKRIRDLEPEVKAERAAGVAPMRGSKQDLQNAARHHLTLLNHESMVITRRICGLLQKCCLMLQRT